MVKIITNNADDEFHEIDDLYPLFELQDVPANTSEKWFPVNLTQARLVAYETGDGELLSLADHDVETAYRVRGVYHGAIEDADEVLRREFTEMCREMGTMLGKDEIADNEGYAAWTDALCKDGDICEDTYNEGGAYHE